jgi:hypothetical protein
VNTSTCAGNSNNGLRDQVSTHKFRSGEEGGGQADPEATYNLCLVLKIML